MSQDVSSIAIGRMVAYHRKKIGWNQGQLAERVNTTQSTISRIERGEVLPDVILFRELANTFETTTDDLYKKMDEVIAKAEKLARIVSQEAPKKTADWWEMALLVVGISGVIALIGATVAALMGDQDAGLKALMKEDQD